jgi:hypothetical protein
MPARFQQPAVFTKRLWGRVNVLEAIQRSDVVKRLGGIGQSTRQVAALDLHVIQPKELRIQVTAAHLKSFG